MPKPRKNYVTPAVRTLSLLLGGLVTLLCWIVLALFSCDYAFLLALMMGAGSACLVAAALALWLRSADRRYLDVEADLGDAVRFSAQANVTVGDVSRSGYLFLTPERLIACFRDRQPYTRIAFERTRGGVVQEISPVSMNIIDAGHSFEIVTSDCDRLAAAMHELGWTVFSPEEDE